MTTKELLLSLKSYEDFDKHRREFRDLPIDDETLDYLDKLFGKAYAPKDMHHEIRLDDPDKAWNDERK